MINEIVDLKREIKSIEAEYDDELSSLKNKIKELTDERLERTLPLEEKLGELLSCYIDGSQIIPKGSPMYLRVTKGINVIDPSEVPSKYWSPDMKLITAQMKESDFTEHIPGVEITERKTVVVRTS